MKKFYVFVWDNDYEDQLDRPGEDPKALMIQSLDRTFCYEAWGELYGIDSDDAERAVELALAAEVGIDVALIYREGEGDIDAATGEAEAARYPNWYYKAVPRTVKQAIEWAAREAQWAYAVSRESEQ